MSIINETKIKNEIAKIEKVINGQLSITFEKGVEFAENELQNLAIEFANWLNDNYDMTENKHEWDDWTEIHTTEKCFELFLEWRKKQV